MSAAARTPMSLDSVLAWERAQELRFEFDGYAPVAMTGRLVRGDATLALPEIGFALRLAAVYDGLELAQP